MLTRADRGSVLLLFPAATLAIVVLAALTVDVGYTQVRSRELHAVAQSAANDVLTALDIDALRAGEGIRIDPEAASRIATEAVARGPHPDAQLVALAVTPGLDGEAREIAVTLRLDIDLVFAPAIGDLDRVTLTRTGRAVILSG